MTIPTAVLLELFAKGVSLALAVLLARKKENK
jgi:hypothetical protein